MVPSGHPGRACAEQAVGKQKRDLNLQVKKLKLRAGRGGLSEAFQL